MLISRCLHSEGQECSTSMHRTSVRRHSVRPHSQLTLFRSSLKASQDVRLSFLGFIAEFVTFSPPALYFSLQFKSVKGCTHLKFCWVETKTRFRAHPSAATITITTGITHHHHHHHHHHHYHHPYYPSPASPSPKLSKPRTFSITQGVNTNIGRLKG